jgi:molybdopterin molybdotransferase
LVTFEIFVRPAVDKLSGVLTTKRKKFHAILDHDIESDGRESYLRANVKWNGDTYEAKLVGSQDSGVLSSLVEANALIIIPAGVQSVEQGSIVEAWHLG